MEFDVLAEIDKYRKHPRFQVERHFDIFLIPYLPGIINHFYHTAYDLAVPEFPVRKKLVNGNCKSQWESISVDFALFDKKNKSLGCVELKTDLESNNDIQDKNLEILGNTRAEALKAFLEDRITYRPKDIKTFKYLSLVDYLKRMELYDCFVGNISVYKITPENKRNKKEYLSFSRIVNEYHNDKKDWAEIKKYLERWNSGVKG